MFVNVKINVQLYKDHFSFAFISYGVKPFVYTKNKTFGINKINWTPPRIMKISQGLLPVNEVIIGHTITQNEHPTQFMITARGTIFKGKI